MCTGFESGWLRLHYAKFYQSKLNSGSNPSVYRVYSIGNMELCEDFVLRPGAHTQILFGSVEMHWTDFLSSKFFETNDLYVCSYLVIAREAQKGAASTSGGATGEYRGVNTPHFFKMW